MTNSFVDTRVICVCTSALRRHSALDTKQNAPGAKHTRLDSANRMIKNKYDAQTRTTSATGCGYHYSDESELKITRRTANPECATDAGDC